MTVQDINSDLDINGYSPETLQELGFSNIGNFLLQGTILIPFLLIFIGIIFVASLIYILMRSISSN